MCGRYYVDDDTAREIEKLVRHVDEKLDGERKRKDVSPSMPATVIKAERRSLTAELQYWGFPAPAYPDRGEERPEGSREAGRRSANVIFNARSETAGQRPMFADALKNRRIIVPARGFYEWAPDRTRYRFYPADGSLFYMAGVYCRYDGKNRFVILTREADETVRPIHDRMPVLLQAKDLEEWIMEPASTMQLMQNSRIALERQTDYEQLSLF